MTFTKEQVAYALDVLPNMKGLLAKPENWCKGTLARGSTNIPVDFREDSACSFCLMGALEKTGVASSEWFISGGLPIDDLLGLSNTPDFNDSPTTTHQDILNLLDERIAFFEKLRK